MKYRELVKKVQDYSGFSDKEAESSLRLIVEKIATRLTGGERKDFASQLPSELEDLAMVEGQDRYDKEDMIQEICELQEIDESRAKKQIHAVWDALKDALTPGQMDHIRTQLPKNLSTALH